MSKNKRPIIALIGGYPPPYGGVSVHIQRIKKEIERSGYKCIVYNLKGHPTTEKNVIYVKNIRIWLLKYLFSAREDIIHVHDPDWHIWVIASILRLRGKIIIISVHNDTRVPRLKKLSWIKKYSVKFALRHISFFITVNVKIKKQIVSLGVNPANIAVIPAFIPPVVNSKDINEVPSKTWQFIDSHHPIISANAFRINFYKGQDLYGIDLCIDLCKALKKDCPDIGFVFALPDIGDYNYFAKMQKKIKNADIEDNFLFQTKPCQFYPILTKSDVFIRPTNTDGDSVSLREALYFKVPSIASDVCERPAGTVLFHNRDTQDLILKTKQILDNYTKYRNQLKQIVIQDYSSEVIAIYRKLLKIHTQ